MIVLAGGKVTSAGIIVVKDGRIKSLSPLSGHYRSSIDVSPSPELVMAVGQADEQHYRSFVGQLEQKGVDLSHVKIAKSVLVSAFRFRPSSTDSQLMADTMGPIKVLSFYKSKQGPNLEIQSNPSPPSWSDRKGEISRTRSER